MAENLDPVGDGLVGHLYAGLQLYDSFKEQNQKATQSIINTNIRETRKSSFTDSKNSNAKLIYKFLHVVRDNPYQRAGFPELSWTLQIIYDSTRERAPHYRDVNGRNRVNASSILQFRSQIRDSDLRYVILGFDYRPHHACEDLRSIQDVARCKGILLMRKLIPSGTNRFEDCSYNI